MVISLNCLRVDPDLGEVLARLPEWTRAHLSSVAVESPAHTLELLHPGESCTCRTCSCAS
jgi:hypothetical protein